MLDLTITGWSTGLISEGVSLAHKITTTLETGVRDCSVEGASNPEKGLLEPLCLFLRGRIMGGVFCWGVSCGTGWPRQVRHRETNVQGPCYIFEPCLWLVQRGRGLRWVYVLLGREKLCQPNRHWSVWGSPSLPFEVPSVELHRLWGHLVENLVVEHPSRIERGCQLLEHRRGPDSLCMTARNWGLDVTL